MDHRYAFPNGNELVLIADQPGFRLERNGEVILTRPEPVRVFPATDSIPGWAGETRSAYVTDVPSAAMVLLEVEHSAPDKAGPWIFALTQEGQVAEIMRTENRPALQLPSWQQLSLEAQGHTYVILVMGSWGRYSPFVEFRVMRSDLPGEVSIASAFIEGELKPSIENGRLKLDERGMPINVVAQFEPVAMEHGLRALFRRLANPAWKVPSDAKPSFVRDILPHFEAGLQIRERNLDLETAQTFLALGRPHEQLIPTLLRIAREEPPENRLKPGQVNRPLTATRLLADYAELDPRALEALDRLALEAGASKAGQEAAALARRRRKDLLTSEWYEALMGCARAFE